jgi:hypothetical protein
VDVGDAVVVRDCGMWMMLLAEAIDRDVREVADREGVARVEVDATAFESTCSSRRSAPSWLAR